MFCDIVTVGTVQFPGNVPPGEKRILHPALINSDGSTRFCQRIRMGKPASSSLLERFSNQA